MSGYNLTPQERLTTDVPKEAYIDLRPSITPYMKSFKSSLAKPAKNKNGRTQLATSRLLQCRNCRSISYPSLIKKYRLCKLCLTRYIVSHYETNKVKMMNIPSIHEKSFDINDVMNLKRNIVNRMFDDYLIPELFNVEMLNSLIQEDYHSLFNLIMTSVTTSENPSMVNSDRVCQLELQLLNFREQYNVLAFDEYNISNTSDIVIKMIYEYKTPYFNKITVYNGIEQLSLIKLRMCLLYAYVILQARKLEPNNQLYKSKLSILNDLINRVYVFNQQPRRRSCLLELIAKSKRS